MTNKVTSKDTEFTIDFGEPTPVYANPPMQAGGTYRVEMIDYTYRRPSIVGHPGPGHSIRWGCYGLNHWFRCGSGRSWPDARAIAIRHLRHMSRVEFKVVED